MRIKYNNNFFHRLSQGGYNSAKEALPSLINLIKPKSAIDLGCGTGAWLKVLNEFGVEKIVGVEGQYIKDQDTFIPKENYIYHDLERKFSLDQKFNIALSLEVGEHLSPSVAQSFIDSLCELSDIVIFSAAIPGQEGTHHINEQLPEYWAKRFMQNNFVAIDYFRKFIWDNKNVEVWYKQNLLLFVNADRLNSLPEELRITQKETNPDYLFRIHPTLYYYILKRKYPSAFANYWWRRGKEGLSIVMKKVF